MSQPSSQPDSATTATEHGVTQPPVDGPAGAEIERHGQEDAEPTVDSRPVSLEALTHPIRHYFAGHLAGRQSIVQSLANMLLLPVGFLGVGSLMELAMVNAYSGEAIQPAAGLTFLLLAVMAKGLGYLLMVWGIVGATLSAWDRRKSRNEWLPASSAAIIIAAYCLVVATLYWIDHH